MINRKAVLLVAVLLAGVTSVSAEKPNGKDYSRAGSREATVQGTQVVAESSSAGVPTPRRNLTVEDSTGKFVGLLIDPAYGLLARRAGDLVVLVLVDTRGSDFLLDTYLGDYETPDCSGQAFMPAFPALTPLAVVRTEHTLEYPSTPYVARTLRSYLFDGDTEANCVGNGFIFIAPDRCCITNSQPQTLLAGPLTTNMSVSELVPPFHVEGL